jgi:hypothetical protein
MASKISLEKASDALKVSLAKRGINRPPEAEIALVFDVSGSYLDEHRNGTTQQIMEGVVPWGVVFEPDGKIDVFTFSDGAVSAHHVGDVTVDSHEGFIQDHVVGQVPGWGGGTDYSHVIDLVLRHFGWLPQKNRPTPRGGRRSPYWDWALAVLVTILASGALIGYLIFGMMGAIFLPPAIIAVVAVDNLWRAMQKPAKPTVAFTAARPTIVLFVTDGQNQDAQCTREVLRESRRRGDQIFFIFLGVGYERFPFLEALSQELDNVSFARIPDSAAFTRASNEEVNDLLISNKLVDWLRAN